jgi:hypothetical protein
MFGSKNAKSKEFSAYQREPNKIVTERQRRHRATRLPSTGTRNIICFSLAGFMAKSDPTKILKFKRVLDNLFSTPPKPHSEVDCAEHSPQPRDLGDGLLTARWDGSSSTPTSLNAAFAASLTARACRGRRSAGRAMRLPRWCASVKTLPPSGVSATRLWLTRYRTRLPGHGIIFPSAETQELGLRCRAPEPVVRWRLTGA